MKVSCLQENLRAAIAAIKPTAPPLGNILLEAKNGYLTLTTTNLEWWVSHDTGCRIEQEGTIAVPAKAFADLVNQLPKERVDLEVVGNTLQVRCERYDIALQGTSAEDYPSLPVVADPAIEVQIDSPALRKAIYQVEPFAASNDFRMPVLAAASLTFKDYALTIATSDSFLVAVHSLPLLTPGEGQLLVPIKALRQLYRLLAKQEHPIEMRANATQAAFTVGKVCLVTSLMQGRYPNYAQLIPQSFGNQVTVVRQDFLSAVGAACIAARSGSGTVRLETTQQGNNWALKISGWDEEGGKSSTIIDARVTGGDFKIAFNGRYLVEILKRLATELVTMEGTFSNSPRVFKSSGQDTCLYAVMPMFVKW